MKVKELTVSIDIKLILSISDTISGNSKLICYFKLQKISNRNNSKLPCDSSTTDAFVIMQAEISALWYFLLPINQQLSLLHTMKLIKNESLNS